jgi:serine protease inhibitor
MRSGAGKLAIVVAVGLIAAACSPDTGPDASPAPPATGPDAAPLVAPTEPGGSTSQLIATVTERDTASGADAAAVAAVADAANEFAVNFFTTAVDGPTGNVVVGNYSISSVLLLTMAGTADDTTTEFADLLAVDDIDPADLHDAVNALDLAIETRAGDDLTLSSANTIFVQDGLEMVDGFLDVAVGSYGAPINAVDFADVSEVAAEVNDWVSARTDGFIEKLTAGYDPATVVVLVNAMYLQATWDVLFRRLPGTVSFTTSDGRVVQSEAMAHDVALPLDRGDDYVAVELPYAGGNLAMVVVQPDDLAAFEAELSAPVLDEITAGLIEEGIHLTMPIWSTETTIEALDPLQELGLPTSPNFANMFVGGDSGYVIDSVSHVARIEVDETGTTAAAATDLDIAGSHGPTIAIDRPFFYFIRDRVSGTILFMGHVTDPTG